MITVELIDFIGCLEAHPIKIKIINTNKYFLILKPSYF